MRAAASRTFCTAGRSSPMRTAMIAITTNSSISVKATRRGRRVIEDLSLGKEEEYVPGPPNGPGSRNGSCPERNSPVGVERGSNGARRANSEPPREGRRIVAKGGGKVGTDFGLGEGT